MDLYRKNPLDMLRLTSEWGAQFMGDGGGAVYDHETGEFRVMDDRGDDASLDDEA